MKPTYNRLSNTTKVWVFFICLFVILLSIGNIVAGRWGLFLSFMFSIVSLTLIYFFGRSQLLSYFQARKIYGSDPWKISQLVEKYSLLLQIPQPDIYLIEKDILAAFSVSNYWQKGAICISTGLLKKLTEKEVEAIITHQLCHIYRFNNFKFALAHITSFSIIGLGSILDYLWPLKTAKRPHFQKPFSYILSPIAWVILKMTISDKVYYQSDDMTAALLHNRKIIAEVLWKIDGLQQNFPLQLPPCNNHFFAVQPGFRDRQNWILLTHPNIDERIERLIGYFPI